MPISLYNILYLVTIIGFFVLAALAYLRQKTKIYRNFALFAIAIGLWQTFQFAAQVVHDQHSAAIGLFHLSIVSAGFAGVFFYVFACEFANKPPRYFSNLIAGTLLGVLSLFSPNISGAHIAASGISLTAIDIPYAVLLLGVVYYFLSGIVHIMMNLVSSWKIGDKVTRQRDSILIAGILQALVLIAFFSVAYANSPSTQIVVPICCFLCVAAIAYAVIYYGLLDIRLVVARALVYALTLVLIMLAYGAFVLLVGKYILGFRLGLGAELFFALSTGILTLWFQSIKHSFDRVTKKIFFQESYDPQELFDQLNRLLVSSLDIAHLMRHSAAILEDSLHPIFCVISLQDAKGKYRFFGTDTARKSILPAGMADLQVLTEGMRDEVIVTDYLTSRHADLQMAMQSNNIAALVRLSQNVQNSGVRGFIVLGMKKRGSPYSSQDVRVLQTVANELTLALQNALRFEEIENFNLTLQQRVDEATRKMRRTNEKLKALDEAKDDFVSMASHQLRTPLTSIKGYTSMVLEGDAGPINKTQRELLQQAFFSSQRMVYLIADLLNVSRLKTGKFLIEANEVNLADLVEQEINQLKDTAAGRQLTLTYEKPEKFPSLTLDETKTRQVIMNFVDNAIYYTPAGGHIAVKLQETPTTVELKVVDNGIGVPKVEQPHLFTKFYRAGNARKARPDGTGLGLFMAKKVIVAEGGAIIFETEEGKGSTFGFVFPKKLT